MGPDDRAKDGLKKSLAQFMVFLNIIIFFQLNKCWNGVHNGLN